MCFCGTEGCVGEERRTSPFAGKWFDITVSSMGDNDLDKNKFVEAMGQLLRAADSPEKNESGKGEFCISSEQLAAFIDNKCTVSEAEKIKSHLADCKTCNEQWLMLSTLKIDGMRSSRRGGKARAKVYGVIGAALVLAACVVLFLYAADKFLLVNDSVRSPAPTHNQLVDLWDKKIEKKAVEARPGLGQGADRVQGEQDKETILSPDRGATASGASFETYRKKVYEFCQHPQMSMVELPQIRREGNRLLQSKSVELSQGVRQRLPFMMVLLGRVEAGEAKKQCKEILDVLRLMDFNK